MTVAVTIKVALSIMGVLLSVFVYTVAFAVVTCAIHGAKARLLLILVFCSAGWSGVTLENKNTIPLTVTRQPNTNNLAITTASDLPAGEYLLIADQGKGYDGYDFSVK
ncbi:MAG: hypothetical protein WCF26_01270 [Candidatus Sulfotelmatobacter sp.]